MLLQKSFFRICCFYDTDISQGSVETHVRCGGIFNQSVITIFSWLKVKLILKIGYNIW